MASAIVRIKRHLEEEPLETLILNCKKIKTKGEATNENTSSTESSTILKFAGTVNQVNFVLCSR